MEKEKKEQQETLTPLQKKGFAFVYEMQRQNEELAAQVADYEALNPAADLDALSADLVQLWCDDSASGYPGDSLATLTVPLLAVRGEDDYLLLLAEWAALRDLLPDAHLLQLPWASHEVLRDQPQLFWSVAQRFYGLTV